MTTAFDWLLLLGMIPLQVNPPEPTLAEVGRFPDNTYCRNCWLMATRYGMNLEVLKDTSVCPAAQLNFQVQIAYARYSEKVWDLLQGATNPDCEKEYRLRYLSKLKQIVGERAFYASDFPPPIPMYAWSQ